ncbi:ATP-binding protein [Yinghuangia sp. YIM S10712]|uniref:ATP-binding protein n=1 Tax=Yinghuangia sp. YIM S10712 TaxID=3436930 RepID=UPI003F531FCC
MCETITHTHLLADAPESAGIARAHVAELLTTHHLPHLVDDATLLVSELVTNALRHGIGKPELSLGLGGSALRIEVTDLGPGLPYPRTAEPEDKSGRGLWLVQLLANRWGFTRWADGKSAWCELARA